MPKQNRLGFMTEAAKVGKHDLEKLKEAVSLKFYEQLGK